MLSISSIEVIRGYHAGGNPGLAIGAVPPEKLELTYGDTLRINTSFVYRAPTDIKITLVGSIGQKVTAEAPSVILPRATDFTPITASVKVPITADIKPGTNYKLYCKIKEYPEASDEVDNVITITGIPPTFELLEETIYPYAYIYEGTCDISTFTFKTDPFIPASWIAGRLASYVEDEVRKIGGRVMEMRVYVDKTPLLWTNWQIEVIGIPAPTIAAVGWAAVILAALILAIIIALTWSIKTIVGLFTRKPALEDVKVGWGKETLIKTIQDSEEYWKRTPTPVDTLDGMSEVELRDYLDKIATEEMPKGIGWGTVAILGALGLGALALATRKRKK